MTTEPQTTPRCWHVIVESHSTDESTVRLCAEPATWETDDGPRCSAHCDDNGRRTGVVPDNSEED